MTIAGIVLAGGKSTRMGRDKATLPFGPELLVQRMTRILGEVVRPVVVVATVDQQLPPLPDDVLLARDDLPDRGPLEGLHAGLLLATEHWPDIEAAFVTSCDVPLLSAGFVREVIARLGEAQAAVPVAGGFPHPLAAVYRTSVMPTIQVLLATGQSRMTQLLDRVLTVRIGVDQLRNVDPHLWSLKNCNRPEDYDEALRLAGF